MCRLILLLYNIFTAAGIRKGMEKMQRAFEIYPYCAMALNYLANHFFFTGQHFLVEQLTETALAVTNHGPTKAHSYYNLARSYHSKVGNNTLFLNTILMRCAKFLLAKKRWKEGEIKQTLLPVQVNLCLLFVFNHPYPSCIMISDLLWLPKAPLSLPLTFILSPLSLC